MMYYRFGISTWAVVTLVALRLTVGWHFFQEGLAHYSDPAWSVDGFLRQAKGPLAPWTRAIVSDGDFHGWNHYLIMPRQQPADPKGQIETRPYDEWLTQVKKDWQEYLTQISQRMNDEERARARAVREARERELEELLAVHEDDIRTYQHELWRSEQMRQAPGAADVPNQLRRILARQSDPTAERATNKAISSGPGLWLSEAKKIEADYKDELASVLKNPESHSVATETRQPWMVWLHHGMQYFGKYGVLVVGALLIVGLFSRLASYAGALFLLTIIAMQPPWLPEAMPTYYVAVEMMALFVLGATAAGRWAGVDFFFYRMFGRG